MEANIDNSFLVKRGGDNIFFSKDKVYKHRCPEIADFEVAVITEKIYPEIFLCHEGATYEQMQEAYSYYQYVPITPLGY